MKFLPIYALYLVMGFGDLIGTLVALVQNRLEVSAFQASFLAFAGFLMFGILSLPAGLLQGRVGKKRSALAGLFLMVAGLMVPVAAGSSFPAYVASVLLLGGGITVLQVAGGPLLQEVSSPQHFPRNLTFAQFVKGVGSISAPLLPVFAFHYLENRWELLFPIYAGVTGIVLMTFLRYPESAVSVPAASISASLRLLAQPRLAALVTAIFMYVGAEVCLSSALPSLLESQYGYRLTDYGLAGTGLFFASLMGGRLIGSWLLNRVAPAPALLGSAVVAVLSLYWLATGNGMSGFLAAALTGLAFANIFPLVFAIALQSWPQRADEVSGLMVSAIAGGAFLPPLMGFLSSNWSVSGSLLVPGFAMVYVTVLAVKEVRRAA